MPRKTGDEWQRNAERTAGEGFEVVEFGRRGRGRPASIRRTGRRRFARPTFGGPSLGCAAPASNQAR